MCVVEEVKRISTEGTWGRRRKIGERRTAFTAEKQRAQRKPKATAARFDEAEPAATHSEAMAKREPSLRSG
jgi:hypothetical protein